MVYLHSVPEMKAVIFADIILEPRNIVIYYSPLIRSVISLSILLLSSLPLKPFPPLSPLLPTYHFILVLIPLLTFSMSPLLTPFTLYFSPHLPSYYFPFCLSPCPLLSFPSHIFNFSLSFYGQCLLLCLCSPIWFNK